MSLQYYQKPSCGCTGAQNFHPKDRKDDRHWLASCTGFDECLPWQTFWGYRQRMTAWLHWTIQGCWCTSGICHRMWRSFYYVLLGGILRFPSLNIRSLRTTGNGPQSPDRRSQQEGVTRRFPTPHPPGVDGEEKERDSAITWKWNSQTILDIWDTSLGTSWSPWRIL